MCRGVPRAQLRPSINPAACGLVPCSLLWRNPWSPHDGSTIFLADLRRQRLHRPADRQEAAAAAMLPDAGSGAAIRPNCRRWPRVWNAPAACFRPGHRRHDRRAVGWGAAVLELCRARSPTARPMMGRLSWRGPRPLPRHHRRDRRDRSGRRRTRPGGSRPGVADLRRSASTSCPATAWRRCWPSGCPAHAAATGLHGMGRLSPGTAKTMLEALCRGGRARIDG